MSEPGHTPGPWRASGGYLEVYGPDVHDGAVITRVIICTVAYSLTEDWHANKRLIAAAPELLAACEQAAKHHQGFHSEVGRALRDAIAKARGGM